MGLAATACSTAVFGGSVSIQPLYLGVRHTVGYCEWQQDTVCQSIGIQHTEVALLLRECTLSNNNTPIVGVIILPSVGIVGNIVRYAVGSCVFAQGGCL